MRLFIITLLFIFSANAFGQDKHRVMFYNTENMFDTVDNPKTNDDEYTPTGSLRWTKERYAKKVNDVARLIDSVGGNEAPIIVGLCEVENRTVMDDLVKAKSLLRRSYRHVITSSKDSRGSNVALLYRPEKMSLISSTSYRPEIDKANFRTTRDILCVTLKTPQNDTVDVFVCHFPSRREGVVQTKPYRMECAKLLKQKTDSLFGIRKKPSIVIMGDFNDYPHDESLYVELNAKGMEGTISPNKLYNLFYNKNKGKEEGSYKYKGKWNYLDQFIVSGTLLNKQSRVRVVKKSATTYRADFFMETSGKNKEKRPQRTYGGVKYLGGISDHLPIYVDLVFH